MAKFARGSELWRNLPDEEKELRAKHFVEANEALDQKRYYALIDIAERYAVSTPRNYKQQTRWMKREEEKNQQLEEIIMVELHLGIEVEV